MLRLTNNEKRLGAILLLALFILANGVGLSLLAGKRKALGEDLSRLEREQLEAQSWLAEKDRWMEREKWLDARQPRLVTTGEANAKLLATLQTTARQQKVTIVEQSFAEPATQPRYQEISVKLKVSGTLEALTRWLVELQQPEQFQVIKTFSLKSDAEPPKVKCDLEVARWYAP